jgi:hypothetical protein
MQIPLQVRIAVFLPGFAVVGITGIKAIRLVPFIVSAQTWTLFSRLMSAGERRRSGRSFSSKVAKLSGLKAINRQFTTVRPRDDHGTGRWVFKEESNVSAGPERDSASILSRRMPTAQGSHS